MAQLIVRKLDPVLVEKLKLRAAEHGLSAEEEHRRILRGALLPEIAGEQYRRLKDLLFAMPDAGDDADFERNRELAREIDL